VGQNGGRDGEGRPSIRSRGTRQAADRAIFRSPGGLALGPVGGGDVLGRSGVVKRRPRRLLALDVRPRQKVAGRGGGDVILRVRVPDHESSGRFRLPRRRLRSRFCGLLGLGLGRDDLGLLGHGLGVVGLSVPPAAGATVRRGITRDISGCNVGVSFLGMLVAMLMLHSRCVAALSPIIDDLSSPCFALLGDVARGGVEIHWGWDGLSAGAGSTLELARRWSRTSQAGSTIKSFEVEAHPGELLSAPISSAGTKT